MVALELKKVLAYSTVSQIGFMWLGLGVAGFTASILVEGVTSGIFHLISHALFKTCLFLCAGSVLHAAHSIYMQDMGALKKFLPYTWIFMLVAALSLIGFPPLPGFWSKDAVLISSLKANRSLFLLALISVAITSFYTLRFIGMVFHGRESENVRNLKQKGASLGDGYRTMWGSCGVLAIMIILMGLLGPRLEHFLQEGFHHNLAGTLHLPVHVTGHSDHHAVPILSVIFILMGAVPAYFLYISRRMAPEEILEQYPTLKVFHRFFWNRWRIEDFYNRYWVGGSIKLSNIVGQYIEDSLDNAYHKKFVNAVVKLGTLVARFIENFLDRFYHRDLPDLVKIRVYSVIKHFHTEELIYSIGYILMLFLIFFFIYFVAKL